jgi:hypothetical protein
MDNNYPNDKIEEKNVPNDGNIGTLPSSSPSVTPIPPPPSAIPFSMMGLDFTTIIADVRKQKETIDIPAPPPFQFVEEIMEGGITPIIYSIQFHRGSKKIEGGRRKMETK